MGLFGGGGDVNVNKHGGKRSGMFKRGFNSTQNSKKEGGIERKKKHENVKLKEDVPGRYYLEKN